MVSQLEHWPDLPLSEWADTCATLHLWTQVVGKIRLAHAPLINHWWQVPLYVTSRGLTTSVISYGARSFQLDFDFLDHNLTIQTSDGATAEIALAPRTVADFYAEVMSRLRELGLETRIWKMPVEIPDAVPFDQDRDHASVRPGVRAAVLAHPCAGGPRMHAVPVTVPRQGEPGALLLGKLRSRGQSLFRTHRADADEQLAQSRCMGHAGGLLARGEQLRLLARQRGVRPGCVLQLCVSGAAGFFRGPCAPRCRTLRP